MLSFGMCLKQWWLCAYIMSIHLFLLHHFVRVLIIFDSPFGICVWSKTVFTIILVTLTLHLCQEEAWLPLYCGALGSTKVRGSVTWLKLSPQFVHSGEKLLHSECLDMLSKQWSANFFFFFSPPQSVSFIIDSKIRSYLICRLGWNLER